MDTLSKPSANAKKKTAKENIYFKVRNVVIDVYGPVIGPIGIAVYAVLLRRAGMKSTGYPSRRDIARLSGTSVDAVDDALKRLTGEDGRLAASGLKPLIEKHHRVTEKGDLTSNMYWVLEEISTEAPNDVLPRRKRRSDFGTKRLTKTTGGVA